LVNQYEAYRLIFATLNSDPAARKVEAPNRLTPNRLKHTVEISRRLSFITPRVPARRLQRQGERFRPGWPCLPGICFSPRRAGNEPGVERFWSEGGLACSLRVEGFFCALAVGRGSVQVLIGLFLLLPCAEGASHWPICADSIAHIPAGNRM